jgi:hypothetical protein
MTTVHARRATEALCDRRRSQGSGDDVFAYAAAKICWGWKFGLPQVRFSLADNLRLAAPQDDIDRVALAGSDVCWTRDSDAARRRVVIYCAGASSDWDNTPAWRKRLMQVLGRLELKAVGRVKHGDEILEGRTR